MSTPFHTAKNIWKLLKKVDVLFVYVEISFQKLRQHTVEFAGVVDEGVPVTEKLSRLAVDKLHIFGPQLLHCL